MSRHENWGYPTGTSPSKEGVTANAAPAQPTSSTSGAHRRLKHFRIILSLALFFSLFRVAITALDGLELGPLLRSVAGSLRGQERYVDPIRPALAAVPELRTPAESVWRCPQSFTNNPDKVQECNQVISDSRTDQNGNKYFTGAWAHELQDEYYR